MPQHAGNSSRCFNYIYFRLFAIHFGRHCHTFCGQPLHQDSVSVSAWIQIWRAAKSRTSGVRPERQLLAVVCLFAQRLYIARFDDIDLLMIWRVLFGFPLKVLWLCCSAKLLSCFDVLCWSLHVSAQWYQYHDSSPNWFDLPHCLLYFHVFLHSIDNWSTSKPFELHYSTEELQKGHLCRHLLSLVQIM